MEGRIEFFANVPSEKWVVVKKMKVEDSDPLDIARFLASVHMTLNNKMFQFMGDALNKNELDKIAADIVGATWNEKKKEWQLKGRIGENKITEILVKLKSPKVSKAISSVVKGKKSQNLAKLYVTRQVLEFMKFPLEPDPKDIEKVIEEQNALK